MEEKKVIIPYQFNFIDHRSESSMYILVRQQRKMIGLYFKINRTYQRLNLYLER